MKLAIVILVVVVLLVLWLAGTYNGLVKPLFFGMTMI